MSPLTPDPTTATSIGSLGARPRDRSSVRCMPSRALRAILREGAAGERRQQPQPAARRMSAR